MGAGIYRITNVASGGIYVGSAINTERRRKHHWWCLSRGRHSNQRIQRAWNKYGADAFEFAILELAREQIWIDELRPTYNLGVERSPETKSKLSASLRGNKNAQGRVFSPEAIERIRAARIKYWQDRKAA